jgi:hypothetical protein
MPQSSRPRKRAHLSESLLRQLNSYALAASAAGVGILALAQPAEAKIVHTPAHVTIGLNGSYKLDLNHDGTTDFVIQQVDLCNSTTCNGFDRKLLAKEALGNAVAGSINKYAIHYASALNAGAGIGPHRRFISGGYNGEIMGWVAKDQDFSTIYYWGRWINVRNRYLGLKFKIKGKFHYGWARLDVQTSGGNITGTLTGYAYETVPNKPIIAGKTKGPDVITVEPGSLGRLAQGSAGRLGR